MVVIRNQMNTIYILKYQKYFNILDTNIKSIKTICVITATKKNY